MNILVKWLISALAILVAAYILPGVHVAGFVTALVVAVVLGIVNGLVRPVLVILTLPLTIITFGLFSLVLNTLLLLLAAALVPGFVLDSFWWALAFGIVLALVNAVLDGMFGGNSDKK